MLILLHSACWGPFGHSYFALSFAGVVVWHELSAFMTAPQRLALCLGACVAYIAYIHIFNYLWEGLWVGPVLVVTSNSKTTLSIMIGTPTTGWLRIKVHLPATYISTCPGQPEQAMQGAHLTTVSS